MHVTLALALLAVTWLLLRRQASSARPKPAPAQPAPVCWAMLPLDVAPIMIGWFLLLAITHRPAVAATIISACGAGLVVADLVKRDTLREPLVFADRSELLEVVRHPRLYLPFAGPVKVAGVLGTALIAVVTLLWLEPSIASPPILPVLGVILVAVLLPGWPPLLSVLARLYRAAGPTGDPATDMQRFGFLACLIVHATIARAERPGRRAAIPDFPRCRNAASPLVMLQVESFFDARRLGPNLPDRILPGLSRLQSEAIQTGLLEVPCWGANTVRTEFAALTGINQAALGLDRFNPYERFAQKRLRSIAWQMKQAGYRTICLHPFDKGFYARDRVMPLLGFDEFRGPMAFVGAPMAGPYIADEAMAQAILHILRTEGPRVFVFAITMGNHGPWDAMDPPPHRPFREWPAAWNDLAEAGPLRRFIAGLQASDRMFDTLADGFPTDGLLAVYGDHQPSLPGAFAALDFEDQRTDYAVWQPSAVPRTTCRICDIRAEDLPDLLLRRLDRTSATPVEARPMDAMVPDLP